MVSGRALLSAVLSLSMLAGVPSIAQAAGKPVTPESAALAAAGESGRPVSVVEETTETAEVVANPDGTLTRREGLEPQRVRRDGKWVPIDLSLEVRPDGSVGPKAAAVDVRLSGGGAGDGLAVAARDGKEIGIGWSGVLPAPRLSGALATYPDVMPGIDLTVRVTGKGFSQLLVVKNRQAASDPRLKEISFPHHVRGVTPRAGAEGKIEVVDDQGQVVFGGDASRMWDSAVRVAANSVGKSADQVSTMDFEVTREATVIRPDPGYLTAPERVFPVLIDPEYWWAGTKLNHAVVQSAWPDEHNFNRTGGDLDDLKAGYQNGYISRSFFSFDVSAIRGKVIYRAKVRPRVVHSWSCAGGPTELWHVWGFDWGTTWNNQPLISLKQGDITKANNAGHCPSDGATEVNVDGIVRQGANELWPTVSFMLRARDEARQEDWRRFALDPVLEVVYNSVPLPPAELGMEDGLIPCASGVNRPFVFTQVPRLRGRISDPDGGMVNAHFALHKGPIADSHAVWHGYQDNVPSGSFSEVQVPTGIIENNSVYNWSLVITDGGNNSIWVGNCEFEVDTTAPGVPTIASTDYPGGGNTPAGGIGQTGTFTLSANGTADTAAFLWSATDQQNDDPKTRVAVDAPGGTAIIRWTPTTEGPLNLFVRSVDRAGNLSSIVRYSVFVAPGDPLTGGLVGHWKLDGDLTDSADGNHPLTAEGGAAPTGAGYNGQAVDLAYGKHLHTSGPVLDTGRSYSVSAWVRLDQLGYWPDAVSQDGVRTSGFQLQGTPDGHWGFVMFSQDVDGGGNNHARVVSPEPAQAGVWTHLIGVYDQGAKELRLYVNGAFSAKMSYESTWSASGPLQIGTSLWTGTRVDFFPGAVDDVRAYQRVLVPSEAAALSNEAIKRAHYPMAEGAGTTTKDSVTNADATLSGPAAWTTVDGRTGVNFTGVSGTVNGPRPTLRTDRSYTVSAFVRLDATGTLGRTAVSLTGARNSPFMLQYRPELQKWALQVSHSETQDGVWWIPANTPVETRKWVHLAAVYDHAKHEARMYVNGVFAGTQSGITGWNGAGELMIGGGVWQNGNVDPFLGAVRGVRIYSGTLTDEAIGQLPVQN
ncbi:LamG-like jellyroll fold domain-containing protein [Actinokineospora enzanensis]|uniref:LamG-like jellyroll fold domain-containing protein n=1 Tax=Actinokineospora enzanensis TaxID=155975 RepID=UPI00039B5EA8|nr:LamG-like jellyroll fold domain-containing protein [Actinokineospora enzanensis]